MVGYVEGAGVPVETDRTGIVTRSGSGSGGDVERTLSHLIVR